MKTKNLIYSVLSVLILFCSCSSDEENPIIPESEKDSVEIQTRVMVDGEDVTGSYASTAAGYTTGDGKYSEDAPVVVTATANPGYTLVSFTDNIQYFGASSYSFKADIDRFFWAKFQQNSGGTASDNYNSLAGSDPVYTTGYQNGTNRITLRISDPASLGLSRFKSQKLRIYYTRKSDGQSWSTDYPLNMSGDPVSVSAESFNIYNLTFYVTKCASGDKLDLKLYIVEYSNEFYLQSYNVSFI